MPDLTLDTTSTPYQKRLSELRTIRSELAPRIKLLRTLNDRGDDVRVRWLLQRDALLRNTIVMARGLVDFLGLDAEG